MLLPPFLQSWFTDSRVLHALKLLNSLRGSWVLRQRWASVKESRSFYWAWQHFHELRSMIAVALKPTALPWPHVISQVSGLYLQFLIEQVWTGAWSFTFLIISHVMLILLVLGPHFENHCSNGSLEKIKRNEASFGQILAVSLPAGQIRKLPFLNY